MKKGKNFTCSELNIPRKEICLLSVIKFFVKFETAMWKAQQKIFIIQQNKMPKRKTTTNKQTKITLKLVNEEIFHIETKET